MQEKPTEIPKEGLGFVSPERELELLRYALDKSAIVAITDASGRIVHVNEKFCEISRYSRTELIGKTHRIINSGHHSQDFFREMWRVISGGQIWEGEICNRAKDGSHYWVNTTIIPFPDSAGKPYQYVSIRFDVTRRKQAEERLRIYAERLESSNRELQDFASVAAHDLQEPLRKIQAFGDRLATRFSSALSDEAQDYLQRMLASASRMRRLIDDLLTYSRVSTQAKPFVLTDLDLVLNEVLSDLELRVEQVKAKIVREKLLTIEADASQIRQLLQNLLANALKFHRKDVVPEVSISASIEGDSCILSVADNGIGFEEKYLDRIFTIFQRLHGRHEYEGTGVGLAVCRRIVERHSGTITAESRPGGGARFLVTLPLRQKRDEAT